MNIKQLIIFKYFVEEQNENVVAAKLNITQPTVTFHLKNLNSTYGVDLYYKKEKHFKLTQPGELLYRNANKVLNLIQETNELMTDFEQSTRGILKIGASHAPVYSLLPNAFRKYMNDYPNVELSLTVETAPVITEKVKNRDVEIGIISEKGLNEPDINVKRLFENPIMLAMDKSHPLAKQNDISITEILEYPFIIHSSGSTRESINEWQRDNFIDLQIQMQSNNLSSILETIRDSKFLSLISQSAIQYQDNIIAKSLPNPPASRYISLIYRSDRYMTPLIQHFVSLVYKV